MDKIFVQGANTSLTVDFGQGGYSPSQSGYKALATANLPEPTIKNGKKYFDTILYAGNGTGQKVGQFQPITETYSVGNSALFIAADTCELTKTFGSAASSTQKGTLSVWLKPNDAGMGSSGGHIMNSDGTGGDFIKLDDGIIKIQMNNEGEGAWVSTDKILDTTQWTNLVVAYETDNSTATDRIQIYINGVNITDNGSFTATVTDSGFDIFQNGIDCNIGGVSGYASASYIYDGYMAEYVWCDGQVLTPSSFGEVDSTTNRWIPKDVSGLTFGNNGFYLDFADKNDLGDDESGNTNDWTESGFDTTNGSNQFHDTPTRNFSTLSPAFDQGMTLTDGNTLATNTGTDLQVISQPNMAMTTGKWYVEMEVGATGTTTGYPMLGIRSYPSDDFTNAYIGGDADLSSVGLYTNDSTPDIYVYNNIASLASDGTVTNGDVIQMAFDADTLDLWWGLNNTWMDNSDGDTGDPATGAYPHFNAGALTADTPSKGWLWGFTPRPSSGATSRVNFGAYQYFDGTSLSETADAKGYFRFTPPTDFKALNNDNLTESDSFQSAFSWIKNRDAADEHMLFDRPRGIYKEINSNDNTVETTDVDTLQRFLKQGALIGDDVRVNTFNENYVYWDWFIEATGSGTANTDGATDTTLTLVDTTSGFSIGKYQGTGSTTTFGHGLGAVPAFMSFRNVEAEENWRVYHKDNTAAPETEYLSWANDAATTDLDTTFNDTAPTSTVFTVGSSAATNQSGKTIICYIWIEIEGYSKFGFYTGNGLTDGAMAVTGFKPAYVMIKKTSGTGNWVIYDSARSPYNEIDDQLLANTTAAETTGSEEVDFLANGFKIRTADSDVNSDGGTYVYAAFASNPFGGASTTPGTAY